PDPPGFHVLLCSVRAQPSYGGLDVVDSSRERMFRRQAVAHRDGDEAARSQLDAQRIVGVERTRPKTPAMDTDDRRTRSGAGGLTAWTREGPREGLPVGTGGSAACARSDALR